MIFPKFLLAATGLLLPLATPALAGIPTPAAHTTDTKAAASVRIDPTYWWVGMKNPKLQLLVHGAAIGARRMVRIAPTSPKTAPYSGATIESIQPLENPD
jgi:hypothetical protein